REIWSPIPQATVCQRIALRSEDSAKAIPRSKKKPRIPIMELKGLFLYVAFDVFDDGFGRRPGQENLIDSDCLKGGNVLIGNNSTCDNQHVIDVLLLQELHNSREDDVMRAREDREADAIDVFLQSRVGNLLWSLA